MAGRIVIVLTALGALFAAYWLALPVVRGWMLPDAGGARGILWVIGPPQALRFGACTVLSALTLPFLLRPLGRSWREADLRARGAALDPLAAHHVTRTALLIRGGLLFVIYGVCGLFYFVSYGVVFDRRIEFHSLLGTRSFEYGRIVALEHHAPEGGQVDRYAIAFDDESWGYFESDCEGLDDPQARAIAAHVAARTGQSWAEVSGRR